VKRGASKRGFFAGTVFRICSWTSQEHQTEEQLDIRGDTSAHWGKGAQSYGGGNLDKDYRERILCEKAGTSGHGRCLSEKYRSEKRKQRGKRVLLKASDPKGRNPLLQAPKIEKRGLDYLFAWEKNIEKGTKRKSQRWREWVLLPGKERGTPPGLTLRKNK